MIIADKVLQAGKKQAYETELRVFGRLKKWLLVNYEKVSIIMREVC